ncbi:leucine-rich_repeat domain-containing protein [Hexamita inflata]|uniref:Partial n=1 Tax=Hexamita inflata TaxID=28002 RepID=A0AA86V620_9EUKA|nr:leucine-rich repeat domain-containing protein [Hexamita inflata]
MDSQYYELQNDSLNCNLIISQYYELYMLEHHKENVYVDPNGQKCLLLQYNDSLNSVKFVENLDVNSLRVIFCNNIVVKSVPNNVKDLAINYCNLQQVDEFKLMTHLTSLDLRTNCIVDISDLRHLKQLKILNLSENQISDISALKYLINLEHISLNINKISEIAPLKKLANLMFISITNNQVVDISPVQQLPNLQYLYLSENEIVHIDALEHMIGLKQLLIDQNYIQDQSALQNHPQKLYYFLPRQNQREVKPTQQQILYSRRRQIIYQQQREQNQYSSGDKKNQDKFGIFKNQINSILSHSCHFHNIFTEKIINMLTDCGFVVHNLDKILERFNF